MESLLVETETQYKNGSSKENDITTTNAPTPVPVFTIPLVTNDMLSTARGVVARA
jgi:hypothetical protein